jgi:hydrogenase 3 maturation protease
MNKIIDRLATVWRDGGKLVFLGVGNPLRADDSVGLFIVEELEQKLGTVTGKELRFFLGESAPENFSGAIREFAPTYVIVFDAAEFEEAPGSSRLIEQAEIGGVSFSTHMLPLNILANYLTATAGCQVVVVGIQPKLLEFGYPMTGVVKKAAEQLVTEFISAIK